MGLHGTRTASSMCWSNFAAPIGSLIAGAQAVTRAPVSVFFFDDDDDDPNHQITRTNYRGSCASNSAGEGGSPPHAHQDSCSAGSTKDDAS